MAAKSSALLNMLLKLSYSTSPKLPKKNKNSQCLSHLTSPTRVVTFCPRPGEIDQAACAPMTACERLLRNMEKELIYQVGEIYICVYIYIFMYVYV